MLNLPHYQRKMHPNILLAALMTTAMFTLSGDKNSLQPCVSSEDCFLWALWVVLPLPWVVSSHVCSDQYSDKDWRALCKSLELSDHFLFFWYLVNYLINSRCPWCSALAPLLMLRPRNSLQTVNWDDCRAQLIWIPSICLKTIVLYITSKCLVFFQLF